MPTVKFATGQSVQFDKMPSPQDIQDVANKLGIDQPHNNPVAPGSQPAQTAQPQGQGILSKVAQGAGKVYNSLTSPLLGIAALPVQAGVAAYNKITGSNVPDPYAKGFPSAAETVGAGRTSVTPLNVEQKLGDAAQVGSLLIPGEGVMGAIATGALQGAGSAMSDKKGAAEVATSGLLGGVVGGTVGGATKLAGSAVQKLGETASGELAAKGIQGIRDAYGSALNLNAAERAFENRSGKDLADILMKFKAPLGRYENGTLDASQAIPILEGKLKPLNDQATQVLTGAQGVVPNISLTDTLDMLKNRIQGLNITQAEKNAAMKEAENGIKAEMSQFGTDLTPDIADKVKQGFWGSSFKGKLTTVDKLKGNVDYLTGNTLKEQIEKAIAGTDTDVNLKSLNTERGDLIDAIKRLNSLDGVRLLKGGRLGNIAGGITGAITGAASGMGPVGALAGDYFGTKASQFLQDPATKIATATGKAKAAGLLPNLLGETGRTVGKNITKVGTGIKKSARVTGLLSNLLTR